MDIIPILILGSSYGIQGSLLPVQVRSVFSSVAIGIDSFKLAREHVSHYASSIGTELFLFPLCFM